MKFALSEGVLPAALLGTFRWLAHGAYAKLKYCAFGS